MIDSCVLQSFIGFVRHMNLVWYANWMTNIEVDNLRKNVVKTLCYAFQLPLTLDRKGVTWEK